MNRAARRAAKKGRLTTINAHSTPAQSRVCVATLHARHVEAMFSNDWTNLLINNRDIIGDDGTDIVTITGSLVPAARNAIVRHFLAGSSDWLFMVDDDMAYPPTVLPALLAHADADERPIVGALCFKVYSSGDVEPVMGRLEVEPHTFLRVVRDWQRGALVQVDTTGAACLLVHRRVFETLQEPWFAPGLLAGEELGEDTVFCLSARKAGFPVYVASSVDVGHIKPKVFGLGDYERQVREDIPTYVVVPVREAGDPIPVTSLVHGVAGIIAVPNSDVPAEVRGEAPTNTPWKWNHGVEWAREEAAAEGFAKFNVLFLNDDVVLDVERVVAQLSAALRSDPTFEVAYPNTHGIEGSGVMATHSAEPGGLTFAGWCFMTRGESMAPFDERYVWWYSDTAYEQAVHRRGNKVVTVLDCHVEHLRPNEATFGSPALLAQSVKDEALFAAEWRVDPSSLFLAQHPELLSSVS